MQINRKLQVFIPTAFCLTFMMCSTSLFAQGSPYYFIGFGDPVVTQSARMQGLAGSAVASTESRAINDLNPAAWSMMTRARIEARLGFAYTKTSIGENQGTKRIVKFGGASFGTPLWEKFRIGFALGFAPLTDADAETQQVDTLGTTTINREGGLSQLYMGLSMQPISALNIGARADFLFGNLRSIIQTDISHGEQTIPGVFQREYALAGVRGTFGFLLTLDTLFSELKGLTIGGAFSTGSSLSSKQRTIVTPTNSLLDSTIEKEGFGSYPSMIRLGIASRLGDRYRIEADITGQDFSTATVYSPTSSFTGDPNLSASNRYSLGFERLPIMGEESKGLSFWDKVGIRFGASYATLPFLPPDLTKPSDPNAKTKVNEMSFSTGVGIPMNLESILDFSATLGIRSPAITNASPKDFFFKLGASISLSEKWFVPLRRDDD